MKDYRVVLDLLYPDPFDYIKIMENKKYADYLSNRLHDILPDLKEENITLDIWSFRKFMVFEKEAFRKDIDISDFSFFITNEGYSSIVSYTQDREKFLQIIFKRDFNFYATRHSDLLKTTGFTKLLREVKSFQNK